MNDTYRSKYAAISKEDWVQLGYLPENVPKLTRKVHPIFARGNDSRPLGHEHIWPQYKSQQEYNAMLDEMGPVLELASYILETPKSLDFLYQVAHSARRLQPPYILNNQGHRCTEFGWAEASTTDARQRARDNLHNLSSSLTFQIMDPEFFPDVQGSLAITKPTLMGFMQGVKIDKVSSEIGSASRITINKTYIRRLRELNAQEKAQGGNPVPEKLSLQFILAVALGHEVNHVIANAIDKELLEMQKDELSGVRSGQRVPGALNKDEPFYRTERMAEIGNSWENQVFGGKIIWSGESASDPLFVSKWPSFLTLSGGDPYPTRGFENGTARKYLVPFYYIQNMHRQDFWDSVSTDDTEALYVEKTVGIEYRNPEMGPRTTFFSQGEWHLDDGSRRVEGEESDEPIPGLYSRANETTQERHIRESSP